MARALSREVWFMLRRQDSNLDLTAPKAVVLPLHYGGPRRSGVPGAARQVCQTAHPSLRRRRPAGRGIRVGIMGA